MRLRTSGSNPVGDRGLTDTDSLSDLRRRQADAVCLDGELHAALRCFTERQFDRTQLIEQLLGALLIGDDTSRLAGPPGEILGGHRTHPISSRNVESELASRAGTWKDPTRISLGPGCEPRLSAGTSRDFGVALPRVNGDPRLLCLRIIIPSRSQRSTASLTTRHGGPFSARIRAYSRLIRCGTECSRARRDSRERPGEPEILPTGKSAPGAVVLGARIQHPSVLAAQDVAGRTW